MSAQEVFGKEAGFQLSSGRWVECFLVKVGGSSLQQKGKKCAKNPRQESQLCSREGVWSREAWLMRGAEENWTRKGLSARA